MPLNSTAAHLAAEIAAHDWSDAPYRIDRAGHSRNDDSDSKRTKDLPADETAKIKTNVMWNVAQVMAYSDPKFDVNDFAKACGIPDSIRLRHDGSPSGTIESGLRSHQVSGGRRYAMPGSSANPAVRIAMNSYGKDAAICGEVKLHQSNSGFKHNEARMQPRTFAVTTWDGMAYGEGYIRNLVRRGDWYVVEWDSFWAVDTPYPCTAPGGRHYVDVLM
ncbi:hypothetical protein BS297_16965 [Rhodococcus erythropolis]|uniref:Uncharacterized protein n=1 Tax=Rhodococcus erythropolis TaxID=1833 RepID=A0A5N5E2Z3_RHOER|nr:hypothetical protein BS297_16965 [Rhodococcus erythropolis]